MQIFSSEDVLYDPGDGPEGARLDGGLLAEGREVDHFPLANIFYSCCSTRSSKYFSPHVKIPKFYFLKKLTFWNNFCALGVILKLLLYVLDMAK